MFKGQACRYFLVFFVFFTLLVVSVFISLSLGSTGFLFENFHSFLIGGTWRTLVFQLRLPRTLLGLAVGGGLSLSGVILQGLFRNPLVEPYTLGISGGAAFFVSLAIFLHIPQITSSLSIPFFGFLGALFTIALVYLLSRDGGVVRLHNLLLTGVMVSFISSSLIMLIMAISRSEDLHSIVFWIMGSLQESSWYVILAVGVVSILSLFLSYLFALDLNALLLGEEEAKHLGVDVERTKKLLFLLASITTGFCVSASGIIGFVGLVVPHFVRLMVGHDHRLLLLSSFLGGAAFLVLCDTLARVAISPLELPVGVVTGIVGGVLFIYALTKRSVML